MLHLSICCGTVARARHESGGLYKSRTLYMSRKLGRFFCALYTYIDFLFEPRRNVTCKYEKRPVDIYMYIRGIDVCSLCVCMTLVDLVDIYTYIHIYIYSYIYIYI